MVRRGNLGIGVEVEKSIRYALCRMNCLWCVADAVHHRVDVTAVGLLHEGNAAPEESVAVFARAGLLSLELAAAGVRNHLSSL